ncbi:MULTISPECIES: hotdog domain-containing protein [unclassified Moraxella]|uniref:hotdog domain-containing protein n=1 Tax=unclassified Moraxella TaxID=2685852 RepID=UPI003AF97B8F
MSQDKAIFNTEYRIYLEDTDAGGIVYHANHLKLFERCRRDWLRSLGMTSYFYRSHSQNKSQNQQDNGLPDIQFVVSKANIRYLRPILLDSLVKVNIADLTVKNTSLLLVQQIWLDDVLLSEADITIACVATSKNDKGQTEVRPTRLPRDFVKLFEI